MSLQADMSTSKKQRLRMNNKMTSQQQQDVSLFDLKSDVLCAAHVLTLDARQNQPAHFAQIIQTPVSYLPPLFFEASILTRHIFFHQWHKGGVTNGINAPILTIRLKGACDEVASRVKFCENILHGSYTSGS